MPSQPVQALHRHGSVADGGRPAAQHGVAVGTAHRAVVGEGLADGAAVEAGVGEQCRARRADGVVVGCQIVRSGSPSCR